MSLRICSLKVTGLEFRTGGGGGRGREIQNEVNFKSAYSSFISYKLFHSSWIAYSSSDEIYSGEHPIRKICFGPP